MVNKHDHTVCEHEVRYCKICDVCYCVKCGREWPSSLNTWTYTVPNTTTWPSVSIYPTTCYHSTFSSEPE